LAIGRPKGKKEDLQGGKRVPWEKKGGQSLSGSFKFNWGEGEWVGINLP